MGVLDGRVAIVTGAGTGLGLSIAKALAEEGAAIAVCERSRVGPEAAEELRGSASTPAPTSPT